jgi:hypothetical protein
VPGKTRVEFVSVSAGFTRSGDHIMVCEKIVAEHKEAMAVSISVFIYGSLYKMKYY